MMVLPVLLAALFSVSSIWGFPTDHREVPPQCSDPTFACHDLPNARQCDVVKSCIHDIWSTMSAPDDDENVCQICKEMVKEARDQLLSNMTQEEIKEVFEGSCKLLPIKLIADGCIKAVDELIPELVEMLASRMDPNMVCTVSGLCNAAHLPIQEQHKNPMSFHRYSFNAKRGCNQCTNTISNLKNIASSIPKHEVKQFIESSIQSADPNLNAESVRLHVDSIYTFITETMNPQSVCGIAGICPMSCQIFSKPNDDLTCEFCTNVLKHVRDLITTNTTVEEFRTALLNFCKLTGSFANKCTALVDKYFDTVFDFIRNMDSHEVCALIGVCDNGLCVHSHVPLIKVVPALAMTQRIKATKLMPSFPVSDIDDSSLHPLIKVSSPDVPSKKGLNNDENSSSNEIFGNFVGSLPYDRFSHPQIIFEQDLECNFCKAISFYLKTDLKSDTSKHSVDVALRKVCNKWVSQYPEYCHSFLSKYSSKLTKAIIEEANFEHACYHVKACPIEETDLDVKVTKDPSPLCNLCKTTCNEIESQLKDPSVKKSVEQALYQICSYLPKSLTDECHTFINDNIDNLFNILEQELDGDNVCPALHLCSGDAHKIVPLHVKDLECDLCKDFVKQVQQKLQDPEIKQYFKNVLEKACAILPTNISSECKDFVDQNIDNLINILIQDIDPNLVCSALKICPASIVVKPPKNDDVECDVCKEVISKVVDELKDRTTEDAIRDALDKVCSYFPTSFATKCQDFVNQYAESLITILADEMDPAMVCSALKICPASIVVKPPKIGDVECDVCKEIISKVVDELKDHTTEDAIKDALDKACSYFPTSFATKCQDFVNQYAESLIAILAEEMDPAMVCGALKICPAVKLPKIGDVDCDVCKEIISKVEDELKDRTTEDAIKDALDKVCSYFPASFATKCQNFVNQYVESLITILAEEMDPAMVCGALKICPAKRELVQKWKSKAQDIECQGCQYIFHFIQEKLMDGASQDEIKTVCKRVCTLLPKIYSENCDAFIDEFGSSLLVLVAQELDPTILCKELNVCTKISKPPTQKLSIGNDQALKLDECTLCTTVVDYLDKLLEEDDVDKEITAFVEKACSVVPSFKAKCSSFVEAYGPYILQMIGQLADSKQVCQEIDMCPRVAGHLLGGKKCTFGPSYWCQSKLHASACKADSYCKQKVWNK